MNSKIKSCKFCNETDTDQFSPANFYTCRKCTTISNKKYKAKNKDKVQANEKKYREENKEKMIKYREENKEKARDYNKEYQAQNKVLLAEKKKEYYSNNKEKAKQYHIDNKVGIALRKKEKNISDKLRIAEAKIINGNKGSDWVFYICEFKSETEYFFKYGFTRANATKRFSKPQYTKYDIDIISEIHGSEDFIKGLERKVLLETRHDLYIFNTDIEFDGYTECRTKIDLDLVESLIN